MGIIPEGKSPQIHYLWPHHRSMVRAAFEGARPGELAQAYGMTPSQITVVTNSPLFLAELARLEAEAEMDLTEAKRDLKVLAKLSVGKISEELERLGDAESFPERKLKLKTCFDILDRAGVVKAEPQLHLHKPEHLETSRMSDSELFRDVIEIVKEAS